MMVLASEVDHCENQEKKTSVPPSPEIIQEGKGYTDLMNFRFIKYTGYGRCEKL